jgi:osmotically-inducible protein OsmY
VFAVTDSQFIRKKSIEYLFMKTVKKLTVISSLLLAAGCAHHDKAGRYSESYYSPNYPSSSISTAANSSTESSTAQTFGQSDQTLVTQVQQRLATDASLAAIAPNVQVSAQNGTVTLSGTVSSEREKQQIETVAKGTSGVLNVNNQVQVSLQPTSDRSAQSSQLYRESKTDASKSEVPSAEQAKSETAALDQSRTESATSPSALTGSTNQATSPLPTQNQDLTPTSQRPDAGNRIYSSTNQTATTSPTGAATEAFSVNVQGTTEADRSLGQKVIQELRADTSLAATIPTIKVNVDGSKVTITGTVKNDDEKTKIESAVQRVTGVVNVENQLQVSTNPAATETK